MLLGPFEKQLNLPTLLIDRSHGLCRNVEVVREKHEPFVSLFVNEADPLQSLWISFVRFLRYQGYDLIRSDAFIRVLWLGIQPMAFQVLLGPHNKEGSLLVDGIKPDKVDIASVHRIEGILSHWHGIQHPDIVNLAAGYGNPCRNRTTQINERMHLDCCLGFTKLGSRE